MNPLWDRNAQANAELEALQTDVMRFMAILGLCLAVIFSLLREAGESRPESLPERMEVPIQNEATQEPAIPKPEPLSLRTVAPPAVDGFSLEFASPEALQALLDEGQLHLYLLKEESYWVYQGAGGFRQSAAPDSYYQMRADTVPLGLRRLAAAVTTAEIG